MVSSKVALIIGAVMLVLRRMYVVVEGVAVAGGIEVVGEAVEGLMVVAEVVVYVSVIAGVYGLEAVSEVSGVSEVSEV